jgi:ergothioneine biosynthesis protein EgtB
MASRLTTCAEYIAFMEDGGYRRGDLWLSEGWDRVKSEGWEAPLYWQRKGGSWWTMTLGGMRVVDEMEPVCHVSYFEADAFARWAGARLPTEQEWEMAAGGSAVEGNFLESGLLHPARAPAAGREPVQMFGDVWEWTASAYLPYPGFKPPPGALGEYNAKFMCNQFVLRGGSCATPAAHIRATYRNFFPPDARWQFSGIRLARDE